LSSKKPATPNRRFQFHKRSQQFIRAHSETLSVVAMRDEPTLTAAALFNVEPFWRRFVELLAAPNALLVGSRR